MQSSQNKCPQCSITASFILSWQTAPEPNREKSIGRAKTDWWSRLTCVPSFDYLFLRGMFPKPQFMAEVCPCCIQQHSQPQQHPIDFEYEIQPYKKKPSEGVVKDVNALYLLPSSRICVLDLHHRPQKTQTRAVWEGVYDRSHLCSQWERRAAPAKGDVSW